MTRNYPEDPGEAGGAKPASLEGVGLADSRTRWSKRVGEKRVPNRAKMSLKQSGIPSPPYACQTAVLP